MDVVVDWLVLAEELDPVEAEVRVVPVEDEVLELGAEVVIDVMIELDDGPGLLLEEKTELELLVVVPRELGGIELVVTVAGLEIALLDDVVDDEGLELLLTELEVERLVEVVGVTLEELVDAVVVVLAESEVEVEDDGVALVTAVLEDVDEDVNNVLEELTTVVV